MQLPATIAGMTTDWLTYALREGGVIGEASVVGMQWEVLGEGVGFVGQLGRVRPRYDREEPGAPASLIAKFPSPIPQNRGFGVVAGLYETEIRFYTELAGRVQARTAGCYFARFDPEPLSSRLVSRALSQLPASVMMALLDPLTRAAAKSQRRYALLLEDLAGQRMGDQVAGCDVAEARTALRALARFHAGMWNDEEMLQRAWLRRVDTDTGLVHGLFKRTWPRFKQRYAAAISNMDEIGTWLERHGPAVLRRFSSRPYTLLHGDYRLDNLFFDPERLEDPEAVTIIDWQGVRIGNAMMDVAYFLRPNVAPEYADAAEDDLVREYHEALRQAGVRDYAWEQASEDYTLARAWLAMQGAFLLGALDLSHERGVALIDRAVERSGPSLSRINLSAIEI
jgi:hypothetical protein